MSKDVDGQTVREDSSASRLRRVARKRPGRAIAHSALGTTVLHQTKIYNGIREVKTLGLKS